MKDIKPGEIVYCNATFLTEKKKTITAKELILSREYDGKMQMEYDVNDNSDAAFLFNKLKIKESAKITNIEIIKSMGYKVPPNNSGASFEVDASSKDERMANGAFM